jgi:hypothetical protein
MVRSPEGNFRVSNSLIYDPLDLKYVRAKKKTRRVTPGFFLEINSISNDSNPV